MSWSGLVSECCPALRCMICFGCLCHEDLLLIAGVLEVAPPQQDVRFFAECCPALRCMICFGCLCHEDLLLIAGVLEVAPPQQDVRFFAPALRCTDCCRCLGLEVVAQNKDVYLGLEVVPPHKDVRFADGVLVSQWCPIKKIYDLLPVSWSRFYTKRTSFNKNLDSN